MDNYMYIIIILLIVVFFSFGYFLALRGIAKDKKLINLKDDELIIKKPKEGMVLIAIPPNLLGKLEIEGGNTFDPYEARSLYSKRNKK